jgi:hypothetical protein
MNLLERYLDALRWALPRAKADDILAELRDVLTMQIEDREEALGRPLTDAEMGALFKEFGHPLVVAARYRPQQWLIGPDVFPFYKFVLRVVLVIVICIQVVIASARYLFGGGMAVQILGPALGGLWMSVLTSVGVVTLVFAVLERWGFPANHLRNWKPDQLPQPNDRRQSVWESLFELTAGTLLLAWWVGLIRLPWAFGSNGFRMEPAPIFAQLYWPILCVFVAKLIHSLVVWLRPDWRLVRGALAAATMVAGIALLAIIYRAGHWVTIIATGMPVSEAIQLDHTVNFGLSMAFVPVGVVWLWQVVVALWRFGRGQAHLAPAGA